MRRQNCLSSVSKSALKVAAVVLLVIAMLTMNLSSFVSYAGTPTLVPFTNQGHDNDFEQIDYSRDFVVLQNKATINGQSRKAFYFEDELTDADYTALGGKSNICLEYHSVTADCETFAAMPYYDEANVLGVAGQFHIVAFDKFTSGAHTNGNILANEAAMSKNFGTNELPNGEANYIVNYSSVIASSVPKNDEPIALGIDNTVAIRDNGHKFAINGTEVDRPKILYRDSASKKFINLADVEKDAKDLSAELAKNKVDSGIT